MQEPDQEIQAIVNKAVTVFDCDAPGLLATYLSEVLQWNPTLGLVSRKDPLAACERLLLESLELARLLHLEREHVVDIGSGAGFPGIVWAVSHRLSEVTMIERREKRALFLERTCRTLQLENATAMAADARDAARWPDLRGSFDLAVTMAVGDPSAMAGTIAPLLTPMARFVTTVAAASRSPASIGDQFHLGSRLDGEFGCYAIYHRGV